MAGRLYMVATPIGNLNDISFRALEVLKSVAAIVCEDTRVTGKLLQHFGLSVPQVVYHHHSAERVIQTLIARLKAGESLAYVSDAGTPGLADPGGKLVAQALEAGIAVVPVPGPSAVTAALSVAGFPANRYVFLGYPPHKKGRAKFFKQVSENQDTVVFYESTHRIFKALSELEAVAPTRQLVVCRELTKKFETLYRGTPIQVVHQLKQSSAKGEFVVVVGGK